MIIEIKCAKCGNDIEDVRLLDNSVLVPPCKFCIEAEVMACEKKTKIDKHLERLKKL